MWTVCYTFIKLLNAPLLTTDIYHWMKINRFPFREQIDWLGSIVSKITWGIRKYTLAKRDDG